MALYHTYEQTYSTISVSSKPVIQFPAVGCKSSLGTRAHVSCFRKSAHPCGPFYKHGLTLIPAWISNYIHCNVWDEITYPFLNFNGATVEV